MSKKEIKELTPDQEAQIPIYIERYKKIGTRTGPCNRAAAEASIVEAYAYLKKAAPTFKWVGDPFEGAREAARHLKQSSEITTEEVRAQAGLAHYGSFEAYWVAFYSFAFEVLPIEPPDNSNAIANKLVNECGIFWTFDDLCIISERPSTLFLNEEGKMHNEDGPAISWPSGANMFVFNGEIMPSLMELALKAKFADKDEKGA